MSTDEKRSLKRDIANSVPKDVEELFRSQAEQDPMQGDFIGKQVLSHNTLLIHVLLYKMEDFFLIKNDQMTEAPFDAVKDVGESNDIK
jgi:hypothetical protein